MGEADQRDEMQENYRKEYELVAEGWKYFSGLRFTVAAFAIILHSGLFTLYSQGFTAEQYAVRGSVAFIGILSTIAVSLIEGRNINLFKVAIRRALLIEFRLSLMDGYFHRLGEPELVRRPGLRRVASHTWGIYSMYGLIAAVWIMLLVINVQHIP